jgi:allantoinase
MTPRRYGPLTDVPITRRPKLTWPGGARVALWVNPNIEFFGLDDVMPGNLKFDRSRSLAMCVDIA